VLHEQVSGEHLSGGQLFNEQVSVNLVKYELKGMLKFKGRKFGPNPLPPQTLLIEVTAAIPRFTF
jgi:hypothetical protein